MTMAASEIKLSTTQRTRPSVPINPTGLKLRRTLNTCTPVLQTTVPVAPAKLGRCMQTATDPRGALTPENVRPKMATCANAAKPAIPLVNGPRRSGAADDRVAGPPRLCLLIDRGRHRRRGSVVRVGRAQLGLPRTPSLGVRVSSSGTAISTTTAYIQVPPAVHA